MICQFIPNETVAVPEIPFKEEIRLNADKTALIIVDMQNDFVDPKGQLLVQAAQATIPHIKTLLKTARSMGMHVAFTQDTHFKNDRDTAASAGLRWFHVVMPADGISAQTEFDQALTLRQVSTLYAGDVVKEE
ncbi:MAG: cysteine hydrolase family protein [Anaerolineae bacterium]|nr:cysteine hydrolase family protein [Anaerolineae bacterium]